MKHVIKKSIIDKLIEENEKYKGTSNFMLFQCYNEIKSNNQWVKSGWYVPKTTHNCKCYLKTIKNITYLYIEHYYESYNNDIERYTMKEHILEFIRELENKESKGNSNE